MIRLILATLLIPFQLLATVAPFVDSINHPHAQYIDQLRTHNIVEGFTGGLYRPDILTNRAEFLKVLMTAVYGDQVFSVENVRCMTDFVGPEQWYWVYVCFAKEQGIVHGYPDGTFRGGNAVNLVEALKMTIEAWQIPLLNYTITPEPWYKPYMDIAALRSVLSLFPGSPAHLLTRSEMAAVIVGMKEPLATVTIDNDPGSNPDDGFIDVTDVIFGTGVCGDGILNVNEQCDDGNVLDSDGCSSICIIVPEPVRHAALRIDQRPTGTINLTPGATDIILLAFEALAGRQNVQITSLVFEAETGDLNDMENYVLYADTTNNGVADTLAGLGGVANGVLTFSPTSIYVPDGFIVMVEVRADLRNTAGVGMVGLAFDVSNPAYIDAVGTQDGRSLNGIQTNGSPCTAYSVCWVAVYTEPAHVIEIGDRGNLFVSKSSTPVPSKQLLAGELSDTVLALKLRGEGETVEITDFRIGAVSGRSIDRLELFEAGSSTSFAIATTSGCSNPTENLFCTNTSFTVGRDQEHTVHVKAIVKSDTEGAAIGESVQFSLSAATLGDTAVEARGMSSSADLNQNDGDSTADGEITIGRDNAGSNSAIEGSTHDIVGAKIIAIQNSSIDPDNTIVPNGVYPFGVFRFLAASHRNSHLGMNNVVIDALTFAVNASNVELDQNSFVLLNTLDQGTTNACTANNTTGSITVTCSGLEGSSVSTVASAGGFVDLALQANILNAQVGVGTSTLQASLNSLGNRASTGTISWHDEVADIDWADIGQTTVRSTQYRIE